MPVIALVLLTGSAQAATYYWDSNTNTVGFGTAQGTWAAPTDPSDTQGWSTDSTGISGLNSVTTTTNDALNFGSATTNLDAGTITVSGTVEAGSMTFATNSGAISLSGGTISIAAAFTNTVNNTSNTISSALAGTGSALTKAGSGTLFLSGANTYSGVTTINAGTLSLSGGDDRLATAGVVDFSGSSSLSIANNQTLSDVAVADDRTGMIAGGGGLTLTGSSFSIGNSSGGSQTLNLSGLSSFTYTNAAGAFSVSGRYAASSASGNVVLPATTTITAGSFGVGAFATGSGGGLVSGTLTLGTTATINADTIAMGNRVARGIIQYSSVTNPTLTLRGANGTSAVTSITIGDSAGTGNAGTFESLVDLTTGVSGASTLDALAGTLTIGKWVRNATLNVITTGELRMGGGTLTATTITLGQVSNTSNAGNTTGTLTVSGGTVRVTTLVLGRQTGIAPVSGVFNLNSGANLYAQNISPGSGSATRTFNWNDGTIHNYDSSTDLTINNNLTTFALLGAGAHTFDIDSGRAGTVSQAMSGGGALTKVGAGTLVLSGANTYTGSTMVVSGILSLTSGNAIADTTSLYITTGAKVDLVADETVNRLYLDGQARNGRHMGQFGKCVAPQAG